MTTQEFKDAFKSLPVELQNKIHNLTVDTVMSDEEQAELDLKFGPQWRVYFFGKGFTPTR